MILKMVYKNKRGDTLSLTENDFFHLTNVNGQTMANATISSIITSGVDGDTVTNVQAQPRSIILDLRFKPGANVEDGKNEILKFIKIKQKGTLYMTQNNRTVRISGIVESIDLPRWTNAALMQVTLYCERGFWEDISEIEQEIDQYRNEHYFTAVNGDMLYFPPEGISFGAFADDRRKTIVNAGDVDIGVEIVIRATGTVTNPIIYDTDGNYFGVGDGSGANQFVLSDGETLIITTHKGNKTVTKGGESLYDKIKPGSQWLQLRAGANQFLVESEDESLDNMVFNMKYRQMYV